MKYGKRWTWKRVLKSPIALVVVLVLFLILAKAAWNIHQKAENSARRLAETQAELAKLEERQDDLSKKVSYLSTAEGLEAEIRTKYHAVRKGESVAVIIEDQKANVSATSDTLERGWFRKFLGFFGI